MLMTDVRFSHGSAHGLIVSQFVKIGHFLTENREFYYYRKNQSKCNASNIMSTHDLCYRAEIKKKVYPCKPSFSI